MIFFFPPHILTWKLIKTKHIIFFRRLAKNSSKTIQMFSWKWHRFIHSTLIVTHFASEWNRTSVIWMSVTDNLGVQLMVFYMWMLKWRSPFSYASFANVFGKITWIWYELLYTTPKTVSGRLLESVASREIQKESRPLTSPSLFVPLQPPDPDNMLGSSQDGRALPISG